MTTQAHILIVDDEESIRFFLSEQLSQAGYKVLTAASGEEALACIDKETIDLVLLDLKMGGMDGLQVMDRLEKQTLPPVVIMLTAHASLDSAIGVMRRGGFDYLRKPCRPEELLAGVERGLTRRREVLHRQEMIDLIQETARQLRAPLSTPGPISPSAPAPPPRFLERSGLLLDRELETITKEGQALPITPSEFKLLARLMEQTNEVVSYRELIIALHGGENVEWEAWEERRALNTHLWRLKRKLGRNPDGKPYIVNVRGRGYKFVSKG